MCRVSTFVLATEDPSKSLKIVGATPELRTPAYYDKGVSFAMNNHLGLCCCYICVPVQHTTYSIYKDVAGKNVACLFAHRLLPSHVLAQAIGPIGATHLKATGANSVAKQSLLSWLFRRFA